MKKAWCKQSLQDVLTKKSKYIKRKGQAGGAEGGREEIKEGKKAGQFSFSFFLRLY